MKKIDVFDYSGTICHALKQGVLLTTQKDGFVNTMTIGWGVLGIEWNRSIFIVYVRESRYTREILDYNPEFTINVPIENVNRDILRYCGTESGRNVDKIKEMGLTLGEPNRISVPGIMEFPLTLECRVIYRQKQDQNAIPQGIMDRFYSELGDNPQADIHIAYYGEILDAYILEE